MSGGRLVVCPTPIGNLEDVTLRVLSALRDADVVACEDTRRTRVLLERYGVQASLISYHEHNEASRTPELVQRMQRRGGRRPGERRGDAAGVRSRVRAGAGLRGRGPRGRGAAGTVGRVGGAGGVGAAGRRVAVRGVPAAQAGRAVRVLESPETVVAFESPRRVAASSGRARVDRSAIGPVAVCRELTKVHEEVVRGTAGSLASALRVSAAAGRGGAGDRRRRPAVGPGSGRGRRRAPLGGWRRPRARGCRRGRGADGRVRQRAVPRGRGGTNFGWVRRRREPAARLTLIRDGPPRCRNLQRVSSCLAVAERQ